MRRLWEIVVTSQGADRFYSMPFLILFRAVTPIYQFFSRLHLSRRRNKRSRSWQAKVISVGGITAGGAGKTPVVQYLADMLIGQGKRIAIVHSGYGRKNKQTRITGYNEAAGLNADEVGDETAMMTAAVPSAAFGVGRDKKRVLTEIDRRYRPDVAIIDDGFQRLDIEKDIDMALVPASFLVHEHEKTVQRMLHLFPRGMLRERPQSLRRADVIGVTGSEDEVSAALDSGWIREYGRKGQVIGWIFELTGVECDGKSESLDVARSRRPFLFAGVGSYPRLLKMVRTANIPLAGDYSLGDHFEYDRLDIDMLKRLALAAKADSYLTTAKDVVKLPKDAFDKPLYCLRLAVRPVEGNRLGDIVDRAMK